MDNLKSILKDLRFDSTILIFGFSKGEYLNELSEIICDKNNIYIFEPDINDYNKYKNSIKAKNIFLVSCNYKDMKTLIPNIILKKNFLYTSIQIYDNYDENFKDQFKAFIEIVDETFFRCNISISTDDYFKSLIFENILSNIKNLSESCKFDAYISKSKGIPALIVSAGPSLDKNIETMINNRDKLNKFLIIAGNRTIGPLLENNIKPDLVVSIDPQEITYTMMENYLDADIPLIYCEKSNSKLINNYKGLKITISQGILNQIPNLKDSVCCMSGGSVVHIATDAAVLMGCNPIVFIGQDFGYTFGKDHASIARVSIDKDFNEETAIVIKDVFENDMYSSELLNLYKINLENFIDLYLKSNENMKFINSSYGAHIKGADYKELNDVLNYNFKPINKFNLDDGKINFNLDFKDFKLSLLEFIDFTLENIKKSKFICDDILLKPTPNNIPKFAFVLKTIDDFMKDDRNIFFEGYISTFLIYIKEKLFQMKASDYDKLSIDLIYQCKIFKNYIYELEGLLDEIKNVIKNF